MGASLTGSEPGKTETTAGSLAFEAMRRFASRRMFVTTEGVGGTHTATECFAREIGERLESSADTWLEALRRLSVADRDTHHDVSEVGATALPRGLGSADHSIDAETLARASFAATPSGRRSKVPLLQDSAPIEEQRFRTGLVSPPAAVENGDGLRRTGPAVEASRARLDPPELSPSPSSPPGSRVDCESGPERSATERWRRPLPAVPPQRSSVETVAGSTPLAARSASAADLGGRSVGRSSDEIRALLDEGERRARARAEWEKTEF